MNTPRISIVLLGQQLTGKAQVTIRTQRQGPVEMVIVERAAKALPQSAQQQLEVDGRTEALRAGLEACTGAIMGHLHAGDVLLPRAAETVIELFDQFPDIDWLIGNSTRADGAGRIRFSRPALAISRRRWLMGNMAWHRSETSFWRRSLWFSVRSQLDTRFKVAVDAHLYLLFLRLSAPVPVNVGLAALRARPEDKAMEGQFRDELKQALAQERAALSVAEQASYQAALAIPVAAVSYAQAELLDPEIDSEDPPPIELRPGGAVRMDARVARSGLVDGVPTRIHDARRIRRQAKRLLDASTAGDNEGFANSLDGLMGAVAADLKKKQRFSDAIPPFHRCCVETTRKSPMIEFLSSFMDGRSGEAQLYQDLFAAWATGDKREGFFVEVGVGDGVQLSNTHFLEKERQWTGLLAEPNPVLADAIRASRGATLDVRCVASTSGETVTFHCTEDPELSQVAHAPADHLERQVTQRIELETVSLQDLLTGHHAPTEIDYLSVDVEGLEPEILMAFPFENWTIHILTVEHNYRPAYARLDAHLIKCGFVRVFREFAQFDAWYLSQERYAMLFTDRAS